jgi:hypothetical protein
MNFYRSLPDGDHVLEAYGLNLASASSAAVSSDATPTTTWCMTYDGLDRETLTIDNLMHLTDARAKFVDIPGEKLC